MSKVWITPRPPRSDRLNPSREELKAMEVENRSYPANRFVEVPRKDWPMNPPARLVRALRSRFFSVQVYREDDGVMRMSVHRNAYDRRHDRWKDGISWDDLQHIKTLVGYGDRAAVELYPPLSPR